jgi:hypothetical protein
MGSTCCERFKKGKNACKKCPVMAELSKKERKKLRRAFRKKKKKKSSGHE